MCGIICEISHTHCIYLYADHILRYIKNRGPDGCHKIVITASNGNKLFFCGSVLWMQGPKPIMQPLENNQGVLLYNGDLFNSKLDCTNNSSDTDVIFQKLTEIENDNVELRIIGVLGLLKGPFSLIYYHKNTDHIYFTRDRIGRNSLLFHKNEDSYLLSSVLDRKYECIEVPATHICRLNTNTQEIKLYSWETGLNESYQVTDWYNKLRELQNMPDEEFVLDSCLSSDFENNVAGKINPTELIITIGRNERDFVKEERASCKNTIKTIKIELRNYQNTTLNFIESTSSENTCKLKVMKQLLHNTSIKDTVYKITELLQKSIKVRLERQPNKCKNCLNKNIPCVDSSVGILFSGGLDCTILAFLANKYISKEQSIDLINVSFKKEESESFDVPDRLTGRKSLQELRNLCPDRRWVFKKVNVTKAELQEYQKSTIGDLVYPRQTILDESLGSVLWFAARGKDKNEPSPCRVLLLGSGADELFGGYTRHRNTFKRQGWIGLNKELQLDWKRISFRNLARDNRVICDHGRQPRMPYLDEDFTNYVLNLKPWLKCCPSENLGPGIGDKLMLRLVAFNLGLEQVATFPKRAMQFGSRIANKKEKGSSLSKSLKITP